MSKKWHLILENLQTKLELEILAENWAISERARTLANFQDFEVYLFAHIFFFIVEDNHKINLGFSYKQFYISGDGGRILSSKGCKRFNNRVDMVKQIKEIGILR